MQVGPGLPQGRIPMPLDLAHGTTPEAALLTMFSPTHPDKTSQLSFIYAALFLFTPRLALLSSYNRQACTPARFATASSVVLPLYDFLSTGAWPPVFQLYAIFWECPVTLVREAYFLTNEEA